MKHLTFRIIIDVIVKQNDKIKQNMVKTFYVYGRFTESFPNVSSLIATNYQFFHQKDSKLATKL